ncbi:Zonadhesin [Arthrobotrys entomopaga]|nr:Zonadhesin [Arthrobotrys entomopaga]
MTVYPTDAHGSTITDGSGTISVITFVLTPITTVTQYASTTGLATFYPTDSGGSVITDQFGTISVITYVQQSIVTLTSGTISAYTTTLYPVDGSGNIVTTPGSGTITVIEYTAIPPRPTVTTTLTGTVADLTTLYPTGSNGQLETTGYDGTVTVITFVPQDRTLITLAGTATGLQTLYPADDDGEFITDGSGTVTVITYVVQSTTTVSVPVAGGASATTITPTDPIQTVSVFKYVPIPTVTVTSVGSSAYTTTAYPTDSTGGTILDFSQPATVTYVISQPVVTLTSLGTGEYGTTLYPTDVSGSTITDGSGTITVISVILYPETLITSVARTTGLTTIYPTGGSGTDASGTKTIITFVLQPSTTITQAATKTGLTTLYPTDTNGFTLTDLSGTKTIVTFITLPARTVTSFTSTTGLTTIFPTGASGSTMLNGTKTVVTYVTLPLSTITIAAASNYKTTVYPTTRGTATVITYVKPSPSVVTGPTFQCAKEGYITADKSLLKVNILTGVNTTVRSVLNGGIAVNALGYNVLDNYLYAMEGSTGTILRIHSDGTVKRLTTNSNWSSIIGDVDIFGRYWIASGAGQFNILDLRPGSSTYGTSLGGNRWSTTGIAPYAIGDWATVPSSGGLLWSVGLDPSGAQPPALLSFNMTTRAWTTVQKWPTIKGNLGGAGAIFADDNGDIFFIDNASGAIYRTNVYTKAVPIYVSKSSPAGNLDAGRCPYGNIQSDIDKAGNTVCRNDGLEVAIYDCPWSSKDPSFTNDPERNWSIFDPEYFRTVPPYNQTTTRLVSILSTDATAQARPYGMVAHTTSPSLRYAVMHRGYFVAPIAGTYNFTITGGDNWAGFWLGPIAKGNWKKTNVDATAILGSLVASERKGTVLRTLAAGQYLPVRIILANAGGPTYFSLDVTVAGQHYAYPAQTSAYWVRYSCDRTTAPPFTQPFGNETVT